MFTLRIIVTVPTIAFKKQDRTNSKLKKKIVVLKKNYTKVKHKLPQKINKTSNNTWRSNSTDLKPNNRTRQLTTGNLT